MKLSVFGATGMVGKHVVHQALAKGYTVNAFGRNVEIFFNEEEENHNLHAIKGYVFDETEVYNTIAGSDAVISVLGGSFDGKDKTRSLGIKNIIKQMEKAHVNRIIALGGMGILNAPGKDTLLLHSHAYPAEFLPVGLEHEEAYNYLKQSNLNWTFVCSPDIIDAHATGSFVTNKDFEPTPNNYKINAGDLAFFMLNELQKNEYVKHRVGISN
ncbi:MAG: NAD(P)H-binding protein [Bacteroidetes bacterium]|nr:NAD(P)H-binding protein [Bacteroidota bacterium]MBS1592334.1 NAD(P)H-binding protein [Bacteroidota bacterium]MBS1642509.1 NAD(P)H-binding protein [Bacteroidota bacterium]MBS1672191.1 NAD(P)H-binding protein [Bacteroidota bacterium]